MAANGLSLQCIRAKARELLAAVEAHRDQMWNVGEDSDLYALQQFARWFAAELSSAAGIPKRGGRRARRDSSDKADGDPPAEGAD